MFMQSKFLYCQLDEQFPTPSVLGFPSHSVCEVQNSCLQTVLLLPVKSNCFHNFEILGSLDARVIDCGGTLYGGNLWWQDI